MPPSEYLPQSLALCKRPCPVRDLAVVVVLSQHLDMQVLQIYLPSAGRHDPGVLYSLRLVRLQSLQNLIIEKLRLGRSSRTSQQGKGMMTLAHTL